MKLQCFGLRQKLSLLYVLFGMIPVILVGSLSYMAYSKDIRRNSEITLDYVQEQCADDIHLRLRQYKSTLADILTDQGMIDALRQLDSTSGDPEAYRLRLRERLLSYAPSSPGAVGVTYISGSLQYVTCSFISSDTEHTKWTDQAFRKKFLLPAQENFSTDHYVLQRLKDLEPVNPLGDTLYLSFPFFDGGDGENGGVLVMEIPDSVFLKDMAADLWGGVENFMADRSGLIVVSSKSGLPGRNIRDLPYMDSRLFFSRSRSIQNSKFVLYSFVSRKAVINQVQSFRTWMTWMIIAICVSFFFFLFAVMRRYIKSIMDIAQGIKLYGEGKYEIDLPTRTNDEISIIAERFNQMARENNALLKNLQEQNVHIARMADARRRAEIRALQAQINPHFLYNTLDTINWIAIDNDQREISGMIKALGSLLRYSISNIDQLVLLEAELQWCEKYVYLQQKRFDTVFDFRIEADARSRMFPIHKMLLQPILENCIVHGFEEMRAQDDKHIFLTCAVREDGMLSIELRDNGRGMSEQAVERVNQEIVHARQESDGIGIANVIRRIRLYYGDRGEIRIDSSPGKGTAVRLVIPQADTDGKGGSGS